MTLSAKLFSIIDQLEEYAVRVRDLEHKMTGGQMAKTVEEVKKTGERLALRDAIRHHLFLGMDAIKEAANLRPVDDGGKFEMAIKQVRAELDAVDMYRKALLDIAQRLIEQEKAK